MGNKGKTSAREVALQQKRHQALELRKQGLTYEQIGIGLECATSNAHELVRAAIAQIPREAAREVLDLELGRLDALLDGQWDRAKKGDTKAAACVVRIMERRAAYLGLDAPKKTEIWGSPEPFDIDKAIG